MLLQFGLTKGALAAHMHACPRQDARAHALIRCPGASKPSFSSPSRHGFGQSSRNANPPHAPEINAKNMLVPPTVFAMRTARAVPFTVVRHTSGGIFGVPFPAGVSAAILKNTRLAN
jgi:hypothetical protein